ncbi:hypothetical protein AB0C93_27195 [Streptomyces sp. NPDC048518]
MGLPPPRTARRARDLIQANADDLQVALDRLDEVIAITDTHP